MACTAMSQCICLSFPLLETSVSDGSLRTAVGPSWAENVLFLKSVVSIGLKKGKLFCFVLSMLIMSVWSISLFFKWLCSLILLYWMVLLYPLWWFAEKMKYIYNKWARQNGWWIENTPYNSSQDIITKNSWITSCWILTNKLFNAIFFSVKKSHCNPKFLNFTLFQWSQPMVHSLIFSPDWKWFISNQICPW